MKGGVDVPPPSGAAAAAPHTQRRSEVRETHTPQKTAEFTVDGSGG
jgi:hypothetical protein